MIDWNFVIENKPTLHAVMHLEMCCDLELINPEDFPFEEIPLLQIFDEDYITNHFDGDITMMTNHFGKPFHIQLFVYRTETMKNSYLNIRNSVPESTNITNTLSYDDVTVINLCNALSSIDISHTCKHNLEGNSEHVAMECCTYDENFNLEEFQNQLIDSKSVVLY